MHQILDHSFFCEDLAQEVTVRDYFKALLATLWVEEEGFSGKRPFGNSGWKQDIARELVRLKKVGGTIGMDGDLLDYDKAKFNTLSMALIDEAFRGRI